MNNVYDAFAAAARRFPDRPGIAIFSRTGLDTYPYSDLIAMAERVARLLAGLGIRAGDRCAILADNDVKWCSAYFGALRLGCVVVPLDTAYKARQVRWLPA